MWINFNFAELAKASQYINNADQNLYQVFLEDIMGDVFAIPYIEDLTDKALSHLDIQYFVPDYVYVDGGYSTTSFLFFSMKTFFLFIRILVLGSIGGIAFRIWLYFDKPIGQSKTFGPLYNFFINFIFFNYPA